MKIAVIVGARPQFIKAAVVSHALAARPELTEVMVHTGQHYDEQMDAIFFRELRLRAPDVMIGAGSGSHAGQLAKMLLGVETVLTERTPDLVFVQGDTNEDGKADFTIRIDDRVNLTASDFIL